MTSEKEMLIRYYTLYSVKMRYLRFSGTRGQRVESYPSATQQDVLLQARVVTMSRDFIRALRKALKR